MAHPLTHLTHGIPTRRPFHPAKTASGEPLWMTQGGLIRFIQGWPPGEHLIEMMVKIYQIGKKDMAPMVDEARPGHSLQGPEPEQPGGRVRATDCE
jgi:hypothetical protein